jgi:16S rRNA G1207 methylase RsmC
MDVIQTSRYLKKNGKLRILQNGGRIPPQKLKFQAEANTGVSQRNTKFFVLLVFIPIVQKDKI